MFNWLSQRRQPSVGARGRKTENFPERIKSLIFGVYIAGKVHKLKYYDKKGVK